MAVVLARAKMQAVALATARKKVATAVRKTSNRSAVLCPVDTGLLRSSRRENIGQRGSAVVGEVSYNTPYAAAVHNGRRALTIRPRRAGGRLKFKVGGKTVYARQVHQRARRARPFLTTALREVAAQEGFTYAAR